MERLDVYESIKGFASFGCFGPETPDRPLKRYVARISFEDSSDISDFWYDFDSFEEAEKHHRATEICDLDTGGRWDVEWLQRAVPMFSTTP